MTKKLPEDVKNKAQTIFIKAVFLLFCSSLISCEDKDRIIAEIYSNNDLVATYKGSFCTTKYGGLNYHISNSQH